MKEHHMSIKHILNKSTAYRKIAAVIHKRMIENNPVYEMNRCYRMLYNKEPDLQNPKEFVEKIYWLQLHSDTSLWTKCADKYRVREYVAECGLQDYLPRLYGKWDAGEEIDFKNLPDSFVLKTNNSCGTVIIVKDKNALDQRRTRRQLDAWLKEPYGYRGAQLHYLGIAPCIIAEELLVPDEEQKYISPLSMIDYKVYCFNGKPECILVTYNRTHDGLWISLFDTGWNVMNDKIKGNIKGYFHHHAEVELRKPSCLEEMLKIASTLSRPFAEVRIDLYVIRGRPYIGELTFTSGTGYFTDSYYEYLGSLIDFSKVKRIR